MRLENQDVFKVEVLTVKEFCERQGIKVQPESIYYAMKKGHIDYVAIGNSKYVVMTANTLQYVPNNSPKRNTAEASK